MKYFLLGLLAFSLVVVYLLGFYHHAGAHGKSEDNVPGQECEHGVHTNNPHCGVTPTDVVTPTSIPCPGLQVDDGELDGCPVIASPTPIVIPTEGVEVTPTTGIRTDISSGLSDGKSDGKSSCPSCTEAPKDNYPRSNYDGAVVPWK